MKKQLFIYYVAFLIFFLLISLARRWFEVDFIPFWLGGVLGAILPDIDHLIYVYFLRPHELTSQRAVRMVSQGRILDTFELLASTRSERTHLIFHTAMFQVTFYVFTFLILTSSGSLFGRGLALSFLLHLLVDQYLDFKYLGSISNWMRNLNVNLDRDGTVFYWAAAGLVLVAYGFIF